MHSGGEITLGYREKGKPLSPKELHTLYGLAFEKDPLPVKKRGEKVKRELVIPEWLKEEEDGSKEREEDVRP